MTLAEILTEISQYECRLIEITGGEPLIQKNVHLLIRDLCDRGYEVLLETAGHMDISTIDVRVKRIIDFKCPSSGESGKVLWDNINHLKPSDEVKFVVGCKEDLIWAAKIIKEHELTNICPVIFSPVFGVMDNQMLAEWILDSRMPVRMQIQLHKQIWDPAAKGR